MTKGIARNQEALVISVNPDGSRSLDVRLDKLAPPSDSYLADWFQPTLEGRTCTFNFGKRSVRGDRLVTVLSVVLPLSNMKPLAQTIRTVVGQATFEEKIEKSVAEQGITVGKHAPADRLVTEATKEHSLAANFASLAFNDSDASLAFYRMPPSFDMQHISTETLGSVHVLPMVRIDTSAGILLEFVRSVTEFAAKAETDP